MPLSSYLQVCLNSYQSGDIQFLIYIYIFHLHSLCTVQSQMTAHHLIERDVYVSHTININGFIRWIGRERVENNNKSNTKNATVKMAHRRIAPNVLRCYRENFLQHKQNQNRYYARWIKCLTIHTNNNFRHCNVYSLKSQSLCKSVFLCAYENMKLFR